ncbi:MAG: RES family NAD+ phosphorylase [Ruminococcus sp.]
MEKECRAKKGNVFALCDFIAADKDVMIVDLTMGEKWNPHRQQHEIRRLVKSSQRKNALLKTDVLENDQVCQKNIAAAYANILASELFMPLDSDDKSIAYAPFHCIADYFHSLSYSGIIYQSTVYDKGKSLVLFDKNLAVPVESSIVTYSLT